VSGQASLTGTIYAAVPRESSAVTVVPLAPNIVVANRLLVRTILEQTFRERRGVIIADLGGVEYIDAAGLGALRGSIFLRLNGNDESDAQHAGFVERLLQDGWRSCEGNAAENGSREGKAVVRITRGHAADPHRYVFVDWEALVR
jgi:hypothetical protein